MQFTREESVKMEHSLKSCLPGDSDLHLTISKLTDRNVAPVFTDSPKWKLRKFKLF